MAKSYLLALLLIFTACKKENSQQATPMERTDFFSNDKDLHQKIQAALEKRSRNERLERIESVSYIDSRKKSFAFVFYRSNLGSSNIVVQKEYLGGNKIAVSTVKCDGAYCDCKVKTIISNNGDVSVDCSCTSCTMLTNTAIIPSN